MNMKNILVTGGAGFIGSNLAMKLNKSGYNVTVLDNLSPQIHGNNPEETSPLFRSILGNDIRFINGSVTVKNDWIKALNGQDAVIHLAAETGTGQSMYEIEKYINVNIGGTSLLLDVLTNEKHSVKKIIVASSRAIYGEGKHKCKDHGVVFPLHRLEEDMRKGDFECKCPICRNNVKLLPTDEESKIYPSSIYGITKKTQEELVLTVCKSFRIPAVVFRYQNVYGPGQSLSNPYTGILSIFSTRIKNCKYINIFEDGKESRDFVYVDDAVAATILGLEKNQANYEVFNVGTDKPIDVLTVANLLRKYYNSNIDIKISGNYRIGDVRHCHADLSKITRLLEYKPEISFQKGLKYFCDWVDLQDIQEDKFQISIDEMKEKGLFK
jgi:dTDP-L-rhamnose 4-epimerase